MLQCNLYNVAGVTSGLVVIFYGVTSVVGEGNHTRFRVQFGINLHE